MQLATDLGGLPAPTGSARDLGSHESRDRDLLAPEAKRPPTAVVSYVSVWSVSSRYHYRRELSSSSRGGPNGAKARADLLCGPGRKWGNLRARALAPFGPPWADEDNSRHYGYLKGLDCTLT